MMLSSSDYQFIISHLKSLNIHFSRNWLDETVSYCQSLKSDITTLELSDAVYKQWLLTNLRDLKVASLPDDLISSKMITLNGTYAVQVESMIDCSKSSYSQLLQLQSIQNKTNIDVLNKSDEEMEQKRCLTFLLCDGVQEVRAMEYEYISCLKLLSSDFLPGIKMLLKGPVLCRKGMLLLKQENVQICGGRVDALFETNCLKSLLLRNVRLCESVRENSCNVFHPNIFSEKCDINFESVLKPTQKTTSTISSLLSETNNIDNCIEVHKSFSEDSDFLHKISFEESDFLFQNNPVDDEICSYDNKKKAKIITCNSVFSERKYENNKLCNDDLVPMFPATNNNGEDITCINDDVVNEIVPFYHNHIPLQNVSNAKINTTIGHLNFSVSQKKDFNVTNINSYTAEGNFFKTSSLAKHTLTDCVTHDSGLSNHTLETEKKYPTKVVDPQPFVYLKQISNCSLSSPTIFIVKAIIVTLKSKISIKNDEFALRASISDGSFTIQVNLSSIILENILEFSPCEMIAMMKEKSKNLAINERLKSIFLSAQQKLLSTNCLMKVKVFHDGSIPCIVHFEEVQMNHLNTLKARIC